MFRVVYSVVDGEDGSTGVPKYVFDSMPQHHFVKDFSSSFADEAVSHETNHDPVAIRHR